jgi:hypothetical protein
MSNNARNARLLADAMLLVELDPSITMLRFQLDQDNWACYTQERGFHVCE